MTRKFSISYFSEVSAVITLTARDGYIRAVAEHPNKSEYGTELLPNWFHFSHGSGVDRYDTDNDFEGDLVVQTFIEDTRRHAVLKTLHKLAKQLWPGPKPLMEDQRIQGVDTDSDDELYHHFRHVVLYAYITGKHYRARGVHELTRDHWIDDWVSFPHRKI